MIRLTFLAIVKRRSREKHDKTIFKGIRHAGRRAARSDGNWKVFLDDERVILNSTFYILNLLKGIYSYGDPPLPIPNREVKPVSADGTAPGWESRSMPNLERASSTNPLFFYFLSFSIFNRLTNL